MTTTSPKPDAIKALRRRMNARIRISLKLHHFACFAHSNARQRATPRNQVAFARKLARPERHDRRFIRRAWAKDFKLAAQNEEGRQRPVTDVQQHFAAG